MEARPSTSRAPSLLSDDSLSRRSSVTSNPDVFSDDYALEPIDINLDLITVDDDKPGENETSPSITPYPAIPNRLSLHHRPSSTTKRTNRDELATSMRDGGSVRTSSTSSRFSRVRAQSPYRGPTAPSHPYGMYPQITRTSSIASQSTIRPPERPFVHTGGPEHPYGLYSQNTVDDDDDEDIGTQPIPLGFSALGYGSSRAAPNPEIGDIVLSDGHIEQLPPYTRYADNVVAKGNMSDIDEIRPVVMDATTTESESLIQSSPNPATRSSLISGGPSSAERTSLMRGARSLSDNDAAREQDGAGDVDTPEPRWRKTAHKRVCGGIALWLMVLICAALMLGALLGGVVGGVVGRRQGATEAQKSSPPETTIWLDADPTTTNSTTPTCPTGRYNIPFNRTQEIDSCIAAYGYDTAWGCMDIAYLGMTVGKNSEGIPTIQFDDYSIDTTSFLYGPQPPDFNGSSISLAPHVDRDNTDLGVAMFFYQEFDKLIILPGSALQPSQKRSVTGRDIRARGKQWDRTPLLVGDQPWYCFWNSTISEFWIFLEQSSNGTRLNANNTSSQSSSTPPPTTSSAPSTQSPNYGSDPSHTNSPSSTTWSAFPIPTSHYPSYPREERSYVAPAQYLPQYPRLIKMVEKRRPIDNVQPYCQQMRVLVNWDIVPQEGSEIINIKELEWNMDPIFGGHVKRDTTAQLESNCVCEWMST